MPEVLTVSNGSYALIQIIGWMALAVTKILEQQFV